MTKSAIPENLLATILTRSLDPTSLPEGQWVVRGLATLALDCAVSKSASTEAREQLRPVWPAIVARIFHEAGVPPEKVGPIFRKAFCGRPQELHQLVIQSELDKLAAKSPKKSREGATKVSGIVEFRDWSSLE